MLGNSIGIIVKGLALVLALGVGIACGNLEKALAGEECLSDSDCGNKLDCVIANPNGLNTQLLGWCAETPACANGEQPYCPCAVLPGDDVPSCTSTGESDRFVPYTTPCWDGMDTATCLCLPDDVACEYTPP
jgi:hypothetical protein